MSIRRPPRWTTPLVVTVILALSALLPLDSTIGRPLDAWGLLLVAAMAVPLWFLESRPRAALMMVTVAFVLHASAGFQGLGFAPLFVAIYAVGRYVQGYGALVAAAVPLGLSGLAIALRPTAPTTPDTLLFGVTGFGTWVVAVQQRRVEMAQAESDERDREEAFQRERIEIARDVHDVLAHGLTTIVVVATAAREACDDSREAHRALVRIEKTAREATRDVRAALSVLRTGRVERVPAPSLEDLGALVAGARESGVRVALSVGEGLTALPSGVQLALYRVAQEGLTNAIRHSKGSRVTVDLRRRGRWVDLTIVDDGIPKSTLRAGAGLRGVRERVEGWGGEAGWGRTTSGGFVLWASLPLGESS
ncbi:MAG: histidine kinase [Myxococcota bacterium]